MLIVDDGAGEDTMKEGVFLPVATAEPVALCSRGGEMKAGILPLCCIFVSFFPDCFRDDADLGLLASMV